MVISLLKSGGHRLQASGFSLLVDPGIERESSPGEGEQSRLILRTETSKEISFPTPSSVINMPGEYEISGVSIKGVPLEKESGEKILGTAYVVSMDDLRICFLGGMSREIKDEELEKIEGIDILFMPVGAPYLSEKQALSLIRQIEPKVVIPTSVKNAKLFAEELGAKLETDEKFTVKKKDLTEEGVKLVWLKEK